MFSALALLPVLFSHRVVAQERGANALGEAALGLGVSARVLVVGAHPDDEDTFLIAWLSRGRHVETAYLSLTRGDGGQNLIGNELGEALGVVRTEELIAARRVDGALQFFTRAYDFGYSKDTVDTYAHWPKDSLLGDVVKIVRAFRPHVIVAVFSGTSRDGHGQHQVSGLLAREAYELADDVARFAEREFGQAWTPLKFYRASRFNPANGTLSLDVGEFSPLLGRSYSEIAGESRSQHKSQGFGALQRKGPLLDYLRREGTRVNHGTPAASEASIFDGIDTTWSRFRPAFLEQRSRAALDSLPVALGVVRSAFAPLTPNNLIAPLVRVQQLVRTICGESAAHCAPPRTGASTLQADLDASLAILRRRLNRALQLSANVEVEAFAQREVHPIGRSVRVVVSTHNRGRDTIGFHVRQTMSDGNPASLARQLLPGRTHSDTTNVVIDSVAQPWWLRSPRHGAMFTVPVSTSSETMLGGSPRVVLTFWLPGLAPLNVTEPIVYRFADEVKGEIRRRLAGAPAITVTLDQEVQYAPASLELARLIDVHLRSADETPRNVRVTLRLPGGLVADSATRSVRLAGYGDEQTVTFRVRGQLPAGQHRVEALAESSGETFASGYDLIDYDHIRPQRLYRPAVTLLSVVDVRIPSRLRVAYVAGVGDNIAPLLAQLGVPVTEISARDVSRADLRSFTTVVIGPRAYEAHPELVSANRRLLQFAQGGGTLVVQYGQYEMTQPGLMPYPITINRPHDRVTHEDAPVRILDRNAQELRTPNRISEGDFAGWVQERGLYMPRTFEQGYRALLEMNDPGEPPNRGAILIARVGAGTYVYTTLSFFRQLPSGNPGAARLFVNLLSAGRTTPRTAR